MNQFPEDDMLRRFWQDGKKEAPEGFSDFIMQHLPQPGPLPEALKKPLLSPKAGGFLAGLLIGLGFLLNKLQGSTDAAPTPWEENMLQWLAGGSSWLAAYTSLLPSLGIVAGGVIVLIALDRLLQRMLHKSQERSH